MAGTLNWDHGLKTAWWLGWDTDRTDNKRKGGTMGRTLKGSGIGALAGAALAFLVTCTACSYATYSDVEFVILALGVTVLLPLGCLLGAGVGAAIGAATGLKK